ncbi:DUF3667 domain-containing protein [Zobellia sp. B3R18]|uniref:DUF3667 domain-containing protein n=1 Tax=Zobellia sp. B3R18 TaxID=2841568 RepID=UPI001C07D625|nr:DUF3667 domain-containing protein [Zobellia sp. B3R18]MBU2972763.1 DUF3667 domain-containing protein [Zobellia sp. B3R18]
MTNKPTVSGKGRYNLNYRGTECLNCGHPLDLSDKYCPNCAQANSTKKITIKDYLDEFFGTLISYDSRLLRTLSTLLIKPGKITKSYIDGKRISYTNPFRFLLSLAIIYFLIINFSSNFSKYDKYGSQDFSKAENLVYEWANEINEEDTAELSVTIDSLRKIVHYDNYIKQKRKRDSTILLDPIVYFKKIDQGSLSDRNNKKTGVFYHALKK